MNPKQFVLRPFGLFGAVVFLLTAAQSFALTTNVVLVNITNLWRFNQTGTNLNTAWRGVNYDDSAWSKGIGLFYVGNSPNPKNALLTLGPNTYYFRTECVLNANPSVCSFQSTNVIDDGVVVYVNSNEVSRVGMPAGTIIYSTSASRNVGTAVYEGPSNITAAPFILGRNIVGAELHQTNGTTDAVFGWSLTATITYTNSLQMALRINEVLANNHTLTNGNGFTPDLLEIYNPSNTAVSLADMSISTDPANPRAFIFPAGMTIPAKGFYVLTFDNNFPASATNTGFTLKAGSDAVYLYERPANGGLLVDSVNFGIQAVDYSIGRVPDGTGAWTLTKPTLRATNVVAVTDPVTSLKINEWLTHSLGNNDWFELYNTATNPVVLSGLHLIKNPAGTPVDYSIPSLCYIGTGSGGYVRFWADKNTTKGADHVSFGLSSAGGTFALAQPDGVTIIDEITFGPQTNLDASVGRFPDGSATIVDFLMTPSPAAANYLPIANVQINELLSHTDPPLEDAIELYNPTASPVDISGWFLSDSLDNLKKYRFPTNSVVPANGFKVIYENSFNSINNGTVPFTFNSAHGSEAHVSEALPSGALTGYRASVVFGAAANGVSFGRLNRTGGSDFTAMAARTFGVDQPVSVTQFRTGTGLPNSGPIVGPLVINEIMYHPFDPTGTNENLLDEFVELHNVTCAAVALFDPAYPTNTWKLGSAVDYAFPTNTYIAADDYIIIVPFDPIANLAQLAAFRTRYSVGMNVSVFGPWSGKLSNSGETVELSRPDAVQQPPHPDAGYVPYILVDAVAYAYLPPWPTNANGGGTSLQRIAARAYGNEVVNWTAAAPTAGRNNDLTPTPPLNFGIAMRGVNGSFVVPVFGPCNSNYVIEATTTLTNWAPIVTNRASGGVLTFTDTNVSLPKRFYRARLGP